MKANVPEKIYLYPYPTDKIYEVETKPLKGTIEYIRTSAFIEKVQSFLNKKDDRDYYTIGYIKRHLQEVVKEVGLWN